jgi:hypothetical protein
MTKSRRDHPVYRVTLTHRRYASQDVTLPPPTSWSSSPSVGLGVVQFAGLIVQSGVNAFAAAEQALQEIPWTRRWDKTTVTMEPVGVAGLIDFLSRSQQCRSFNGLNAPSLSRQH